MNKPMTEQEYVATGGSKCPSCGGGDLTTSGSPELDGSCCWVPVECENCGATWNDVYSLVGYGELKPTA